jgi:hypothetical protein
MAVMLSAKVYADPPPRNYVGNFLGYNAEPSNYLSVQGQVSSGATAVSIYLEKMISPHSSFSVFTGEQHYTGRFAASGWSNLELSYKHVGLDFREYELLFSIAPSLEIPTGDPNIVDTNPRAGMDILYEKGLGDLPEAVAPLRALAIEGDFYWDSKITGTHDDLLYSNVEIEYSVEYLCANVIGRKFNYFFMHMTPHLDFEYGEYLNSRSNTTAPDFELTPAIAWVNSIFEVNLGAQIAMNRNSSSTGSVGFVWLLGVSLDQIWHPFAWMPFH